MMAMHMVHPATTSPLTFVDADWAGALDLAPFEIAIVPHEAIWVGASQLESNPPPDDLLVTLRRLLI